MTTNGLLERSRVELKLGDYGVAPAAALTDPTLLPRVQEYRRQTSARMMPLDRDDLPRKVPTADYHISRKVDGEFTVLLYRNSHCYTLNPGGTVRIGLPFQAEAEKLFQKAGIKEAMIAGELYVSREDRRPRVHDVSTVARQPQSKADLLKLRFAAFDIISLNEQPPSSHFAETWQSLKKIFEKGDLCHLVEARFGNDIATIQKHFTEWVDGEDAEGVVLRSDSAGLFKIKPRHTLDAVVVGFTESVDDRQGLLHDLLLAMMRPEGTLQILTHVGGGFTDEQRREMLSDLKDMAVDSEYAEVNSDHVAYQMVRPEWVVEISCLDLISATTRGAPVNRMVLDYHQNGSNKYRVVRRLPLASVISPQFLRRREDKAVRSNDVRVQQVSDIVEVPLVEQNSREVALAKSTVLRREVYVKVQKGESMVRKFVLWATNKGNQPEEFPAYVIHFTDFSPNRATPLARELRVSNSHAQIEQLWEGLKAENIKKGWDLHSTFETAPATAMPVAELVSIPPKTSKPVPAAAGPEEKVPALPVAAAEKPKKARSKKAAEAPVPSEPTDAAPPPPPSAKRAKKATPPSALGEAPEAPTPAKKPRAPRKASGQK